MNMRPAAFEPDPFEIDPRPCELCGLTIDRHEMIDHGEGPEHYCPDLSPDEMTMPELVRRAELRRQEVVAAIIARWEAMDEEIARRKVAPPAGEPEPTAPLNRPLTPFASSLQPETSGA
jgi:hypothetical protein